MMTMTETTELFPQDPPISKLREVTNRRPFSSFVYGNFLAHFYSTSTRLPWSARAARHVRNVRKKCPVYPKATIGDRLERIEYFRVIALEKTMEEKHSYWARGRTYTVTLIVVSKHFDRLTDGQSVYESVD
jgi:hypothetical protein